MKKILLIIMIIGAVQSAVSQNPTTFRNGIRLPNAIQTTQADSLLTIDNSGIVKFIPKDSISGKGQLWSFGNGYSTPYVMNFGEKSTIGTNSLDFSLDSNTNGATVLGNHSFALGRNNDVGASTTFVLGENNVVSANSYGGNFISGEDNVVDANSIYQNSIKIFGNNNHAYPDSRYSGSGGWNTILGGYNEIKGISTTAIGEYLIGSGFGGTVVGIANEDISTSPGQFSNASNYMFLVGNGNINTYHTVGTRSNAFAVFKNGSTKFFPIANTSAVSNASLGSLVTTSSDSTLNFHNGAGWQKLATQAYVDSASSGGATPSWDDVMEVGSNVDISSDVSIISNNVNIDSNATIGLSSSSLQMEGGSNLISVNDSGIAISGNQGTANMSIDGDATYSSVSLSASSTGASNNLTLNSDNNGATIDISNSGGGLNNQLSFNNTGLYLTNSGTTAGNNTIDLNYNNGNGRVYLRSSGNGNSNSIDISTNSGIGDIKIQSNGTDIEANSTTLGLRNNNRFFRLRSDGFTIGSNSNYYTLPVSNPSGGGYALTSISANNIAWVSTNDADFGNTVTLKNTNQSAADNYAATYAGTKNVFWKNDAELSFYDQGQSDWVGLVTNQQLSDASLNLTVNDLTTNSIMVDNLVVNGIKHASNSESNVSGSYNIDYFSSSYVDLTLTGNTNLTLSNYGNSGRFNIVAYVVGDYTLTLPTEITNGQVSGTYIGTAYNKIEVDIIDGKYFTTITNF